MIQIRPFTYYYYLCFFRLIFLPEKQSSVILKIHSCYIQDGNSLRTFHFTGFRIGAVPE